MRSKLNRNRVYSRDVTGAMLVSLNKGMAATLVSSNNPPGIELYYHANVFFCFGRKNKVTDHVSENTIAREVGEYSESTRRVLGEYRTNKLSPRDVESGNRSQWCSYHCVEPPPRKGISHKAVQI